ncbi:hypothetical protein PYCC9005_003705 [Savitreella phatthalungensis]
MSSWNVPESQPIIAGLLPVKRNMSMHRLNEAGTLMAAKQSKVHSIDPENRAMRLLSNSKERIPWADMLIEDDKIDKIQNKKLRRYYRDQNDKIRNFMEIDRLLDSSLPRNVIRSYGATTNNSGNRQLGPGGRKVDSQNHENGHTKSGSTESSSGSGAGLLGASHRQEQQDESPEEEPDEQAKLLEEREAKEHRAVQNAINVNFAANVVLLAAKIAVTLSTNSLSIVASLLDSVLDFLSGVIVLISNRLASAGDRSKYPVGRSRLEPLGVLVFSVIMIVSFLQVALEGVQRLAAPPEQREPAAPLGPAIVAIMAAVVVVKGLCYIWCRSSKSGSVQALAQDALSDVIFNFFSIVFPIIGYFLNQWFLDPLGAVLISIYILVQWARTSSEHIRNLTGRVADAKDIESVIYMAMRFSDFIESITSVAAYHAGDKIVVELDVSLDQQTSLRDSHDLGEALQFAIEHLEGIERAYVHLDYVKTKTNLHKTQGGFA